MTRVEGAYVSKTERPGSTAIVALAHQISSARPSALEMELKKLDRTPSSQGVNFEQNFRNS
ncbi:MAG: hypothetical protein ACJAVS_000850 [Paracoccaceae bacterium]|jgi:hypothetical protein